MVTKEYSIVLAEVNEVLKFCTSDVKNRIPYRLKKYIVQNMDKTYHTSIDISKSLEEQSISNESKKIIALIYRDYLVSDNEKQKLIQQELLNKHQYEETLKKSYNSNNIFKNKKTSPQPLQITVIKDKNLFYKLFDYIKSIFRKKYN